MDFFLNFIIVSWVYLTNKSKLYFLLRQIYKEKENSHFMQIICLRQPLIVFPRRSFKPDLILSSPPT